MASYQDHVSIHIQARHIYLKQVALDAESDSEWVVLSVSCEQGKGSSIIIIPEQLTLIETHARCMRFTEKETEAQKD